MEAAVIFPLLACLFAFLLFFFQIMQIQLAVQGALENTGRKLSVLASMEKEEDPQSLKYFTAAKSLMYLELKEEDRIQQFVEGGVLGISLLTSEFSGDDVFLKAEYFVTFPVGLLGRHVFWIHQQTKFRKWTGYHPADSCGKEDVWVYVAETGTVYHQRRSCPYLDLSISKVSLESVARMRNKSGGKYTECNECGKKFSGSAFVYITDYGDRYHYDLGCSGLKRTVYQIRLSETGGRRACSKCWN